MRHRCAIRPTALVRSSVALAFLVACGCSSALPPKSSAKSPASSAAARRQEALDRAEAAREQGELQRASGDYDEARVSFQRALDVCKTELPAADPAIAGATIALGRLENDAGHLTLAEDLMRQGIALLEPQADEPRKHAGAADLATAYNGLGFAYQNSGRLEEAEVAFKSAMPWYEAAFGRQSANTALLLSNLAELYRVQGKLDLAVPLIEEAYATSTKVDMDPATESTILNNLGTVRFSQDRLAEAQELFERAVALVEKQLGPDHPKVAAMTSNIGVLLSLQEKYPEAAAKLERSLAIDEKTYGGDALSMVPTLEELAKVYAAMDDAERAAAVQARILRVQTATTPR